MPSDKRQRQREGRQYRRAQLEAARKRQTRTRQGAAVGIAILLVVLIVFLTNIGGGKKKTNLTASSTTTTAAASTTTAAAAGAPPSAPPVTGGGTLKTWACPNPDGSSAHIAHFPSTAPPTCIDPSKTYTATLTTNEGPITFTLDTKDTPKTANNFAVLSWYHYYDGTSIDRIDTSIDIEQTGSPNTQSISDPGPGYTIPDEPTLTNSGGNLTGPYKYAAGDVVMARSSGANSGSAQYFFVYGSAASALNSQGTYVIFAHTDQASEAVLNKIAALYEPCPSSDQTCLGGAPKSVVLISKVTITAS